MQTFKHHFRVYHGDTDASGVMYHASYVDFFARARNEWAREVKFGLDVQAQAGVCFIVRDLSLKYILPAKLDDKVLIETQVLSVTRVACELSQTLCLASDHTKLCEGVVKIVSVDFNTFKPKRLSKEQVEEFFQ